MHSTRLLEPVLERTCHHPAEIDNIKSAANGCQKVITIMRGAACYPLDLHGISRDL